MRFLQDFFMSLMSSSHTHPLLASTRRGRPPIAVVTAGTIIAAALSVVGCSAVNNILDVPPPAGVQTADGLDNRSGTEAIYVRAKSQTFSAISTDRQLIRLIGTLSDEFTDAYIAGGGSMPSIDARATVGGPGITQWGGNVLNTFSGTRSTLLLAAPKLHQYEPAELQYTVGEAYALAGYIEVYIAETYCAGMTLDRVLPDGGWEFGMPLTTDSILAVAEAHFDSALKYADTSTMVKNLASVGLGRARLGRGHFPEAKAAVASVPTNFAYTIQTPPSSSVSGTAPNLYQIGHYRSSACSFFTAGDHEGTNGLDFVSAHDPRLVFDTTMGRTCDRKSYGVTSSVWYYPVKFGNPSTSIAISTGVEARLIEAEAALHDNDVDTWANDLNALRADASNTYLQLSGAVAPLTTDSTTTASSATQVDVMFRERAFWLFGTGTRLGDLRRLIRQYGRAANTIYPVGQYGGGALPTFPTYQNDVSVTLPTASSGFTIGNPNYKGCLTSTTDG